MDTAVRAGSLAELQAEGRLLTKVGALPVVVLWHEGRAWAVEDRCPHLGFPLHRGTVEAGLLTCHWHHARFDLASGCTLDPWADDARGFDVAVEGDDVVVSTRAAGEPRRAVAPPAPGRPRAGAHPGHRQGHAGPARAARRGRRGGAHRARLRRSTNRRDGWGSGLTVLVAMANVLPHLDHDDRPLRPGPRRSPSSPATPWATRRGSRSRRSSRPVSRPERLAAWYRRFVDTRSVDAAERTLATAVVAGPNGAAVAEAMQLAAATDHVFIDEGHTLDFTNKAVEALAYAHPGQASTVLTVARGARRAGPIGPRSRRSGSTRIDLVGLVDAGRRHSLRRRGRQGRRRHRSATSARSAGRCWRTIRRPSSRRSSGPPRQGRRPSSWAGPSPSRRPCASPASTSRTTTVTGTRSTTPSPRPTASTRRCPARRRPSCCGECSTAALRVYLDRFLNIPAARLPEAEAGDIAELDEVWDIQGGVDRAGAIVAGYLRGGGSRAAADRGPRPRPAARGRGLPLVPGVRGRRAPVAGLAGGLARVGPRPRRRGPVAGRPHPDPSRAADRRAHRHPPAARRPALRGGLRPGLPHWSGGSHGLTGQDARRRRRPRPTSPPRSASPGTWPTRACWPGPRRGSASKAYACRPSPS